jgi:hypothetical protein
VPRNKLGSAHPIDSKWQITSYLLYGCPIGSFGVPHQALFEPARMGTGGRWAR